MQAEHYQKRILVAVSGLSPAILTETLYALAVKQENPFVPTEIHLITTTEGKQRAENALLKGDTAAFKALCETYQLQGIQFDASHIHVIEDSEGRALSDIRQPEDNENAADFIVDKIKSLTSDPKSVVHVSIAGGRKTMGYYVGYALSLFGREQDRLSHVLVDEDFESCPSFFYPTKTAQVAVNRRGKHINFADAEVYLASIPFVRLRTYLPKKVVAENRLINCQTSFSHTVGLAELVNMPPSLVIDSQRKVLVVNGQECKWQQSDIFWAFYIWVIEETVLNGRKLECPKKQPNKEYAEAFFGNYEDIALPYRELDRTVDSLMAKGMQASFFNEKISRVNEELREMLGARLASVFEIKKVGKRKESKYLVALDESVVKIT